MKKTLINIALSIVTVLALNATASANSVSNAKVTMIYSAGSLYIQTSKQSNFFGCSSPVYYAVPAGHPNREEWFTMFTTALATGKTVKIRLVGCVGAFQKIGYVVLQS